MSATKKGLELTEQHLKDQEHFTAITKASVLRLLLMLFDPTDVIKSATQLGPLIAREVIKQRRKSRAATLAYLADHRAAEAPKLPDIDFEGLYGQEFETVQSLSQELVTSIIGAAKAAEKRGNDVVSYVNNAATGTAAKQVSQASREPLVDYVQKGWGPKGYVRVTDSNPCAFCALLATNGVSIPGSALGSPRLYRSDAFKKSAAAKRKAGGKSWVGSEFAVHNHCDCTLEPVYEHEGEVLLPERSKEIAKIYAEVAVGRPDPGDHFRRYWESRTLPPDYQGSLPGLKRDYTPTQQQKYGSNSRSKKWLEDQNATPKEKINRKISRSRELLKNYSQQIHDRELINGGGDPFISELKKAQKHMEGVLSKQLKELEAL